MPKPNSHDADDSVNLSLPKWLAVVFIYALFASGGYAVGYWAHSCQDMSVIDKADQAGYTRGRASCLEPSRSKNVVGGILHWALDPGDID